MPSGFVRNSASPGCAPDFGQTPSGWTVPTTASPYFGSLSRIVCPPARIAPAARTCASAAARIAATVSCGSSSGNSAIESASSGRPPIAKTSFSAFVAAIVPKSARVVDERREEVEREDERGLVVEPVDGGVVGRREPDQQILRLGGHEPGEELLQAARPGTWPRSRRR